MLRKIEKRRLRIRGGTAIMTATIVLLGSYLVVPTVILLVMSFNTADDVIAGPARWGLSNWTGAWSDPAVFTSILHTVEVWLAVTVISLPLAIGIALLLARTNLRFSRAIEFVFWAAFICPPLVSTYGWMYMLTPDWGFLNKAFEWIPGVEHGPFNVYSFWGIVFVRLMSDGLAYYVILLTPAFRNMDGAMEEVSRVSGSSNLRTMVKVTVPMMAAPIVLVGALQVVRMFQGFEVEYMLGSRFGFYVYSTYIYQLVHEETPPRYASAIVLASITLLVIALIIPAQRWITGRRQYTTVSSSYRGGVIDLGRLRTPALIAVSFLLFLLTALPAFVVLIGSFMVRVGFFNTHPLWTLRHWQRVLSDSQFFQAFGTTAVLSLVAGIVGPILFSILAYMIVRTRWRGRGVLDAIIWISAAMPGILLGLGLLIMFLATPGLSTLFGTIWPLIIVVIVHGKTTGTNVFKGVLIQLHASLEEAGRVAGAGWLRNYFRVVVPVLMPTMVLVGMLNFVSAANTTSSIILLASRDTTTLSILSLQLGSGAIGRVEEGGIISLIIMALSLGLALPIRILALRMGVQQQPSVAAPAPTTTAPARENDNALAV